MVGVRAALAHALEDHAGKHKVRPAGTRVACMSPPPEEPSAAPPEDPIVAAVAAGLRVRGRGARARRADARCDRAHRRPHPDPARHAQPARPGGRRDRHRQDQDPAAAGRAALRARRPGVRRRHQGRPLGPLDPGRGEPKITARAASVGQHWTRDGLPGGVLRARRSGHRHPAARDDDVVRPDAAVARCSASTTPRSPVLGLVFHYADQAGLPLLDLADLRAVVQYLTSDEGKADLKELGGLSAATAGVILRELITLRGPGRRRVLRRAGVRAPRPAPARPRRRGA